MPDTTPTSPQLSPLLPDVKAALRLKTDAFDGELEHLIAACRMDMKIAGVLTAKADSDDDPMVRQAVILYCKGHFGNSADSEKFQRSYRLLKGLLCLAGDYH